MAEDARASLRPPSVEKAPSTQSSLVDSFCTPDHSEAALVHDIYRRLDAVGVPADGFVPGIELTRERRTQSWHDKFENSVFSAFKDRPDEQQHLKILENVDRYGFFSSTGQDQFNNDRYFQHTRIVRLPTNHLRPRPPSSSKPLHPTNSLPPIYLLNVEPPAEQSNAISSSPVRTASAQAYDILDLEPASSVKQLRKETRRIIKWEAMMQRSSSKLAGDGLEWQIAPQFCTGEGRRKLVKRVMKGIPDRWRSAAWKSMLESNCPQPSTAQLASQFAESVEVPIDSDVQIDLDVPRTNSTNILFHTRYGRGQRSLFQTLHCYASLCPNCGYCQGMGPIAATLLSYFESTRAYATMVRMHNSPTYGLHSLFSPGFPGMLENIEVQDKLVARFMPDVAAVFEREGIVAMTYATKWYITLFFNIVPFKTQLRFWDAYFLEGQDAIVLIAVAIIYSLRAHLIQPNASFETIISYLTSYFIPADDDIFMRWVGRLLRNDNLRDEMTLWRKEYRNQ